METPHLHTAPDVGALMRLVLIALLPGTAIFIYQTGWGGIINLVLTVLAAVMFEACLLYTSPSPRDLSTSRMPSSA